MSIEIEAQEAEQEQAPPRRTSIEFRLRQVRRHHDHFDVWLYWPGRVRTKVHLPKQRTRAEAEAAKDLWQEQIRKGELVRTGARPEEREGWVYFIAGGDHVKIGWTEGRPEDRCRTLAASSPFPLELVHAERGMRWDERLMHSRFSKLRVHGEWFARRGELAAFLAEAATQRRAG